MKSIKMSKVQEWLKERGLKAIRGVSSLQVPIMKGTDVACILTDSDLSVVTTQDECIALIERKLERKLTPGIDHNDSPRAS